MTKDQILAEITRTAAANGGVALGRDRFFQETGIKETDWKGKYWVRWRDAVEEAGFIPSLWNAPLEEEHLLKSYAGLVRELGHIPVDAELRLKARQDPNFPSSNTFQRLGNKSQRVARLIDYCEDTPDLADILAIAQATTTSTKSTETALSDDPVGRDTLGYVYLLRAGIYFKIGRSVSFDRRSKELAIQLPERAETVHVIHTDDAVGIEAYWHRRFEAKRKNGEWFALSAQDVKAFKRRKFM